MPRLTNESLVFTPKVEEVLIHWVNFFLSFDKNGRVVRNLSTDFQDGVVMCILLNIICNQNVKFVLRAISMFHRQDNIKVALQLYTDHFGNCYFDISEFSSGDEKIIIEFLINLIKKHHFTSFLSNPTLRKANISDNKLRDLIMRWVSSRVATYQLDASPESKYWSNGGILKALTHSFHPELFPFSKAEIDALDPRESTIEALEYLDCCGIPRFLEAEDLDGEANVDFFALILILTVMYHFFNAGVTATALQELDDQSPQAGAIIPNPATSRLPIAATPSLNPSRSVIDIILGERAAAATMGPPPSASQPSQKTSPDAEEHIESTQQKETPAGSNNKASVLSLASLFDEQIQAHQASMTPLKPPPRPSRPDAYPSTSSSSNLHPTDTTSASTTAITSAATTSPFRVPPPLLSRDHLQQTSELNMLSPSSHQPTKPASSSASSIKPEQAAAPFTPTPYKQPLTNSKISLQSPSLTAPHLSASANAPTAAPTDNNTRSTEGIIPKERPSLSMTSLPKRTARSSSTTTSTSLGINKSVSDTRAVNIAGQEHIIKSEESQTRSPTSPKFIPRRVGSTEKRIKKRAITFHADTHKLVDTSELENELLSEVDMQLQKEYQDLKLEEIRLLSEIQQRTVSSEAELTNLRSTYDTLIQNWESEEKQLQSLLNKKKHEKKELKREVRKLMRQSNTSTTYLLEVEQTTEVLHQMQERKLSLQKTKAVISASSLVSPSATASATALGNLKFASIESKSMHPDLSASLSSYEKLSQTMADQTTAYLNTKENLKHLIAIQRIYKSKLARRKYIECTLTSLQSRLLSRIKVNFAAHSADLERFSNYAASLAVGTTSSSKSSRKDAKDKHMSISSSSHTPSASASSQTTPASSGIVRSPSISAGISLGSNTSSSSGAFNIPTSLAASNSASKAKSRERFSTANVAGHNTFINIAVALKTHLASLHQYASLITESLTNEFYTSNLRTQSLNQNQQQQPPKGLSPTGENFTSHLPDLGKPFVIYNDFFRTFLLEIARLVVLEIPLALNTTYDKLSAYSEVLNEQFYMADTILVFRFLLYGCNYTLTSLLQEISLYCTESVSEHVRANLKTALFLLNQNTRRIVTMTQQYHTMSVLTRISHHKPDFFTSLNQSASLAFGTGNTNGRGSSSNSSGNFSERDSSPAYPRRFLYSEPLAYISEKSNIKPGSIYVFTDLIIVTKDQKKMFQRSKKEESSYILLYYATSISVPDQKDFERKEIKPKEYDSLYFVKICDQIQEEKMIGFPSIKMRDALLKVIQEALITSGYIRSKNLLTRKTVQRSNIVDGLVYCIHLPDLAFGANIHQQGARDANQNNSGTKITNASLQWTPVLLSMTDEDQSVFSMLGGSALPRSLTAYFCTWLKEARDVPNMPSTSNTATNLRLDSDAYLFSIKTSEINHATFNTHPQISGSGPFSFYTEKSSITPSESDLYLHGPSSGLNLAGTTATVLTSTELNRNTSRIDVTKKGSTSHGLSNLGAAVKSSFMNLPSNLLASSGVSSFAGGSGAGAAAAGAAGSPLARRSPSIANLAQSSVHTDSSKLLEPSSLSAVPLPSDFDICNTELRLLCSKVPPPPPGVWQTVDPLLPTIRNSSYISGVEMDTYSDLSYYLNQSVILSAYTALLPASSLEKITIGMQQGQKTKDTASATYTKIQQSVLKSLSISDTHNTLSKGKHTTFGISIGQRQLTDADIDTKTGVPMMFKASFDYLNRYGTEYEGIFRRVGNAKRSKALKDQFLKSSYEPIIDSSIYQVPDVTSFLKMLFRDLPKCLLNPYVYWVSLPNVPEPHRLRALQLLVAALPPVSRKTLKMFMQLIEEIIKKKDVNQMSLSNLAVCLAPNFLWESHPSASGSSPLLSSTSAGAAGVGGSGNGATTSGGGAGVGAGSASANASIDEGSSPMGNLSSSQSTTNLADTRLVNEAITILLENRHAAFTLPEDLNCSLLYASDPVSQQHRLKWSVFNLPHIYNVFGLYTQQGTYLFSCFDSKNTDLWRDLLSTFNSTRQQ